MAPLCVEGILSPIPRDFECGICVSEVAKLFDWDTQKAAQDRMKQYEQYVFICTVRG